MGATGIGIFATGIVGVVATGVAVLAAVDAAATVEATSVVIA